jgi:ribosomal protein S18 acetylase RimI-like enzyme
VSTVRVRIARVEDIDEALELLAGLNELEGAWRVFPPRPVVFSEARDRYARLVTDADGIVVVAEAEGSLVGLGVGEVSRPSSWSDERALDVANVYVDPAHRRQGIGRAIVAELALFAAGRGLERLVLRVFAPNHEAAAFWRRLGFEPRLVQFTARTDELMS